MLASSPGSACPKTLSSSPRLTTPIPRLVLRTRIVTVVAGTEIRSPLRIVLLDRHIRITEHDPLHTVSTRSLNVHNGLLAAIARFALTDRARRVQLDVLALVDSHALSVLQDPCLHLGAVRRLLLQLTGTINMWWLQTVTTQPLVCVHVLMPRPFLSVDRRSLPTPRRHRRRRKRHASNPATKTALNV